MLLSLIINTAYQACSLGAILIGLVVAALCMYRGLLHPLARYPGPRLAKFTNLYSGYHAWKGDIHIDMWRCHEKYGSKVRYAPNRLLVNTDQAFQDIYGYRSNVIKSSAYDALVHRAPNILTVRDKAQHSRRKRIISQGFSDASLRALQPLILQKIDRFCRGVVESNAEGFMKGQNGQQRADGWSPVRNVAVWCDYLAFDIMSGIIFSGDYDALGKPEYRWVIDAIGESNVRMSVLIQAPEVKTGRLDKLLLSHSIRARDRFVKFVSRLLQDRESLRKSSAKKNSDILSFLGRAKDPEGGSALSPTEIAAESTTLVVAGSDTTSTAMSAMLFYLSHHTLARKRATDEVRSRFASSAEIRPGPQLNSCAYLRACIDETLRMTPPAGSALWREVLPGGATIDGDHVPAGCDVGIGVYALHHHSEYYTDPFVFSPERWLYNEREEASLHPAGPRATTAYAPFSSGPRGCIGKSLALMELMLTMATTLYRTEMETTHEQTLCSASGLHAGAGEYQTRDHITAAKDGPMLRFRWRA